MRVLATVAFSFAAGLFLILLLPWSGWYLWAAAGVGLSALALRLWAKDRRWFRRSQLLLWPLAAALVYFAVYQAAVQQPVLDRCGETNEFSATVCAWPEETGQGGKVTVRCDETMLRVKSNAPGGVLFWQGKQLEIPVGKELSLPTC